MAGAIVAAVVVALAIYTRDPKSKLLLEYLKVLVWPVALGGLAWWLRDVLRAKAGVLIEVAVPGGGVKFGPREVAAAGQVSAIASHNLEQPAEVQAGDARELYRAEEINFFGPHPEMSEEDREEELARKEQELAQRVQERREAFEQTFKEGAEWGWKLSTLGFAPKPRVTWNNDEPVITLDMDPMDQADPPRKRRRRRLTPEQQALRWHPIDSIEPVRDYGPIRMPPGLKRGWRPEDADDGTGGVPAGSGGS